MALAARSLHALPSLDGSVDNRYPLGDKPQVVPASLGINLSAFNAAAIDLTGRRQNTAVSINYRTFLTGSSASTAVISVFAISGSLGNWAIDSAGNSLTNSATQLGSGSLQVRAADGAGNVVTFPVQNWSFVAASQTKKWTPGHWMELDTGGGNNINTFLPQIAAAANIPNLVGVCIIWRWKYAEGAQGDYSGNWDSSGNSGFKFIDALVQACAKAGLKFALFFLTGSYGKVVTDAHATLPTYFDTLVASDGSAPSYVLAPGTPGTQSPWSGGLNMTVMAWDSVPIGRFNALHQAYATHYEGNSTFVMVGSIGESALGVPGGTRGYSPEKMVDQLISWMQVTDSYWPTTMRRCVANYSGSDTNMARLLAACVQHKVIVGGPDVRRPITIQANRLYNGSNGAPDYRALNGFVSEIQPSAGVDFLKSDTPDTACKNIFDFVNSGAASQGGSMGCGIFIWWRNLWSGPSGYNFPIWDANIVPFIKANPVLYPNYPTGW